MKPDFSISSLAIALLLCCFSLSLNAQESPFEGFSIPISVKETSVDPTLGPVTEINFAETTFDFGTVEEGNIVTHIFTFTNTGQEPLVLTDAKGSCGCTIPQWPREPIAPGETASITVEFNSKNKMGKRNQRVTITANTDPAQSFIYLTGEVTPRSDVDLTISPLGNDAAEEAPQIEALDPDCFAIYPNPTAELLRLDMEGNFGATATISIFSKTGQLMAERKIDRVEGTIEFQVGHYPSGMYIAHVQIEGKKMQPRCFMVVD